MANNNVKVVVLSDGTWETVSGVQVWEVTLDGFSALCDGDDPKNLKDCDVISTKNIDT